MQTESLVFDLSEPVRIPVTVGGQQYILKEASGEAARRFRNAKFRARKINDADNTTNFDGLADAEAILVSGCLFSTVKGADGATVDGPSVTEAIILGWPDRVQRKLFDEAKRISGIDQPDTVEDVEQRLGQLQKLLELLKKAQPVTNGQKGG